MSIDTKALKKRIASRIAKELNDGDIVNLGIGLPTMVANYVPHDIDIYLQSENGILNMGPRPEKGLESFDIIDSGCGYSSAKAGGAYFGSQTSFGMIRGGHVDVCVLGALQVDQHGNLANWIIPGKMVPGMGGAMDLVVGSKRVIISMLHTQKGKHKILSECKLPLTALKCVDTIVTEMAVIKVTEEGLVLTERHEEYSVEQIQEATEAKLIIPDEVKVWTD